MPLLFWFRYKLGLVELGLEAATARPWSVKGRFLAVRFALRRVETACMQTRCY